MPEAFSDKSAGVDHPQPYCMQTTLQEGQAIELKLEKVHNPLPHATLGDIDLATRVEGPAEFPQAILIQPFHQHALRGIDPTSVRVFRWDEDSRSLRPVWNSGINVAFSFVWAKIRRPGVYVPIGLPRDRMLRELLRTLARQRRYADTSSPEEMRALTENMLALFLETPEKDLAELRQLLTLLEVQTGLGPFTQKDFKFGHGGHVLAFLLPHDATLEGFKERLRGLETPPGGLPEENLFYSPEGLDEPEPPWPIPLPSPWPIPFPLPFPLPRPRPFPPFPFPPWLWSRDWPMYHHDEWHTGHASGSSNITSTNVGTMILRSTIPLGSLVKSIPSIVRGKIYVGTSPDSGSGGALYRIDLASGTVEASFPVASRALAYYQGIGGSPAIVHRKVYFSAIPGLVYCIDAATFNLVWVTDLRYPDSDPASLNQPGPHNQPVRNVNADCWSSPLVVNGKVYVGCGEGESNAFGFVYCLDANTGNVVWLFCTNQFATGTDNQPNVIPSSAVSGTLPARFSTRADPHLPGGALVRGGSVWSSLAYDRTLNQVYVGTGNSTRDPSTLPDAYYCSGVLALDADTGQFQGFFQPPPSDSYQPTDEDVDVSASPMIFDRGGTQVLAIGSKNGAFYLLDPATMNMTKKPLAWRQLLPYDMNGNPLPNIDGGPGAGPHENQFGVFGTAAVHYGLGRIFVGLGGLSGTQLNPAIDSGTTPFMRALDWNTLNDAWATAPGADGVSRYTQPRPPMYTTPGEAGLSSPAVVNDVVFVSTTKPALYALDATTGLSHWAAPGLGGPASSPYVLGPAIYGNSVVIGSGSNLYIYSL